VSGSSLVAWDEGVLRCAVIVDIHLRRVERFATLMRTAIRDSE